MAEELAAFRSDVALETCSKLPVAAGLSPCKIHTDGRWFSQTGPAACGIRALIATDTCGAGPAE